MSQSNLFSKVELCLDY